MIPQFLLERVGWCWHEALPMAVNSARLAYLALKSEDKHLVPGQQPIANRCDIDSQYRLGNVSLRLESLAVEIAGCVALGQFCIIVITREFIDNTAAFDRRPRGNFVSPAVQVRITGCVEKFSGTINDV